MDIKPIKNHSVPVRLIDTEAGLREVAARLLQVKEFAFDTEFNRFRWEYGFNLYLLQIYDGKECYLIDPIRLKDLSVLWPAFEHPGILKILYSGKEDIDLMKRYGCFPSPVFDVQAASRICNHPAVSFSKLVLAEFGFELDKSEQTSNWKIRPLTLSQQLYASNDVIHLTGLKEIFLKEVDRIGMNHILDEENRVCAESTTSDFVPKLSSKQRAAFSEHHQEMLLKLILIRDEKGQQLNVPPFKVVGDEVLEEVIKDPVTFLRQPFAKGFSRRALESQEFCRQILDVARQVKTDIDWASVWVPRSEEAVAESKRERNALENLFKPIKEQVVKTYGQVAGDFYMVGVRDVITSKSVDLSQVKIYQKKMVEDAIAVLGIRLPLV